MYRLALISDLHSDFDALRDALAWIDTLGCDQIVCAGDIVDTGPAPDETIELLRSRCVPCIRGNHDRWALARAGSDGLARDDQGRVLSRSSTEFLAALPTRWEAFSEGLRVVVAHGTPHSDMDGIYPDRASDRDLTRWLDEADADILVVGHTHIPFRRAAPVGRIVVNPGTLLRQESATAWIIGTTDVPMAAPVLGTFGILELPSGRLTIRRSSDGCTTHTLP